MRPFVALALGLALAALPACRVMVAFWSGTGTLYMSTGDCGGWRIRSDSGREYRLTGVPAGFQQGDVRVRYTLRKCDDPAGACGPGEAADVVSLTRL